MQDKLDKSRRIEKDMLTLIKRKQGYIGSMRYVDFREKKLLGMKKDII